MWLAYLYIILIPGSSGGPLAIYQLEGLILQIVFAFLYQFYPDYMTCSWTYADQKQLNAP